MDVGQNVDPGWLTITEAKRVFSLSLGTPESAIKDLDRGVSVRFVRRIEGEAVRLAALASFQAYLRS